MLVILKKSFTAKNVTLTKTRHYDIKTITKILIEQLVAFSKAVENKDYRSQTLLVVMNYIMMGN